MKCHPRRGRYTPKNIALDIANRIALGELKN